MLLPPQTVTFLASFFDLAAHTGNDTQNQTPIANPYQKVT